MITFAQNYKKKVDSELLRLLLIGGAVAVVSVVQGLAKNRKRADARRSHLRPAPVPPPAPQHLPAPAKAEPPLPQPFLGGESAPPVPSAADIVASLGKRRAPSASRASRKLPGGVDPRAAIIYGEILRRRF